MKTFNKNILASNVLLEQGIDLDEATDILRQIKSTITSKHSKVLEIFIHFLRSGISQERFFGLGCRS